MTSLLHPGRYTLEVFPDGSHVIKPVEVTQSTLQAIWLSERLTYEIFLAELIRLGYVSYDGAHWLGTGIQARCIYEFTRSHKMLPAMSQNKFFTAFRATFVTKFTDVRSLQGAYNEFDNDFNQIFAHYLSNTK
jgi:hypothetical protein